MCACNFGCLGAPIKKYFDSKSDSNDKLRQETKSARSHNIDAEEVMGMFSAAQKRAPNATIDFLSCKMRSQKNRTVDYLDAMMKEKRDPILKKVIKLGYVQRKQRRMRQKDLTVELARRQADKQQSRETTDRKRLEKKFKNIQVDEISKEFPDIDEEKLTGVTEFLTGKCVGNRICHFWYEDGNRVMYNGKVEKMKANGKKCVVAYWGLTENYEDHAADYDMSVFELAADLVPDDLTMCSA